MIGLPAGTRIWIAAGVTDLRRGFTGLSGMVQTALKENPFSGHVFVFRGRRGDLIKLLWWSGDGLCLFSKRLERGKFLWPQAASGTVALSPAQLSMLLEGIDWRRPVHSYDPQMASSLCRPSSKSRTERRIEALSSAISTVLAANQVDAYSVSDTIQKNLYTISFGCRLISKPIRTADILSACRLVRSSVTVIRTQGIFVLPGFAL